MASHVASLWNRGLVQLGMTYSPLWGCAIDRVEMVVKVHCGTVLGDTFSTGRQIRMKTRTRRKKWSYRRLMYWVESFLSQRNIAQCPSILKRWLACRGAKLPESDWRSWSKGVTEWFEPSSETEGVSRARRKGRDEIFQAKAEKTLGTDSNRITNGQVNVGSWLGTEIDLYYCAQSANSFSLVLFVSSYTTAIISPQLPCSFTKLS